ncbi:pyocin knob domain-containing protein [Psychrobacter sp. Arc29]|uniref:pyocin knob domain-containing protein n=1 Tax=Psychrobacter sp. Arc29 TaxID=3046690 RepID=UPI00352DF67B
MAIQIPNPGTGNGTTGDNEFVLWNKVKDNFSNQDHAASRLVGTDDEQIPTSKLAFKAAFSQITPIEDDRTVSASLDFNDLTAGSRRIMRGDSKNAPFVDPALSWEVHTYKSYVNTARTQIAFGFGAAPSYIRNRFTTSWGAWYAFTTNVNTYATTTAAGANVVVDSTGKLMRSTSSERYKDILVNLELDDEAYRNAMQLAPIVYRSTAEADNPDYHYYSFSAEALGAFDPAFTLWRDTETVTDDEGNVTEQPLDERIAEGININALLAFSHAIAIKQDKMIKSQAEAIATLTERLDAVTSN